MTKKQRDCPRVISVGGGKGGVGKSIVAGNLAIALAESGRSVVLVDADLGSANQHTLFGIDRPRGSLQALFDHQVDTLDEAATPTRTPGLRVVVGTGAVLGAANVNHGQKQRLLRHIRALEADLVVVDVGAGSSHNVVDLFDVGDVHVVVATPQLTSIQNAYGFLKAAVLRHLRRAAESRDEAGRLDAAMTNKQTERVDEILARLDATDPPFASALRSELLQFDARLWANMINDRQELGIFAGTSRMVRDFLRVSLPLVGHLRQSRWFTESVNRREPLLWLRPTDEESTTFRTVAAQLLVPPTSRPAPDLASSPRAAFEARHADDTATEPDGDVAQFLRKTPRLLVRWPATLGVHGARFDVRVRDVAPGGVGVETTAALDEGAAAELLVDVEGRVLRFPVVVRNAGGQGRAGLAFNDADHGDIDRLLAHARAAKSSG